jgi:anion-transporting  ArsA/GET3 family ATPase
VKLTEDEIAVEISRILTDWNPLGNAAAAIQDLNNYETEAFDILAAMDMYGCSVEQAVRSVLLEAFPMVGIDPEELKEYCRKIKAVLEM